MTDDSNSTADESGPEAFLGAAKEVQARLSGGERLIALGAVILLGVDWVLATLILDDYGLSNVTVLIPIGILSAMYFYYQGSEGSWRPLYGTIVKVGAWALAIIALYGLIDDTLITSNRFSGSTLFFELVLYAVGVLCALGAWQMRGDSR